MTLDAEPVTRRLAEVLSSTTYADLPANVVADAQRAVLDWLGSAIAGAYETPARLVREAVATLGVSDEATVFGGGRASGPGAALANGVSSHILELDDVHKGSTLHAAAPVISAALAVAEREHADGRRFLLAVTVGYDAALRVGEAVNPSHYRFWHPTGTAATFGCAAAAASLLRLSAAQTVDALGSAGTQAAGLWEFNADGAMSKHLHPGKAAFNGILAADLARAGFSGASRILEGERGFFRATSAAHDPSRITDSLGSRWKISENCFKLHSCCGHTHSAIDIALSFRSGRGWSAGDALAQVVAIEIATYRSGYEIVREANPRSPYQAKFSIAYCVVVALLEGEVGLDQFSSERFGDDGVRDGPTAALLSRTNVRVDDALSAKYPAAWPARISITLADGSTTVAAADFPRGNPENPVTTPALEAKLVALVSPRAGAEVAERALSAVGAIDSSVDMANLFRRW